MADAGFRPMPGFGDLLQSVGPTPAGIAVGERDGLGIAAIQARHGAAAALRERVRELHGLDLPAGPRVASERGSSFIGTAPGTWLVVAEGRGYELAASLRDSLAGLASVADLSDGYAVLRLAGPRIRDLLAKGVALDLHPRAFPPGAAAVTSVAHVGLVLWRSPAAADDSTFEAAVPRSYAGSFWHWLSVSAAEFGLALAGEGR